MQKLPLKEKLIIKINNTPWMEAPFVCHPTAAEHAKMISGIKAGIARFERDGFWGRIFEENPNYIYIPLCVESTTQSYTERSYAGYNGRDAVYDYTQKSSSSSRIFAGSDEIENIFNYKRLDADASMAELDKIYQAAAIKEDAFVYTLMPTENVKRAGLYAMSRFAIFYKGFRHYVYCLTHGEKNEIRFFYDKEEWVKVENVGKIKLPKLEKYF